MESNSVQEKASQVIEIEVVEYLKYQINNLTKMLPTSQSEITRISTCIFKLPQSSRILASETLDHLYQTLPHKQQCCLDNEWLKWKYLFSSLSASDDSWHETLKELVASIQPLEEIARTCYSKMIDLSSVAFLGQMVLHGCYILESWFLRLTLWNHSNPLTNSLGYCIRYYNTSELISEKKEKN